MATDKELNEYMSVKKYAPYRLAKADTSRFGKAQQEKLRDLKSKVAERAGGVTGVDDLKAKKRKGKKERMRMKSDHAGVEDGATVAQETFEDLSGSKKRKRDDEKFVQGHGVDDNREDFPVMKRKRKRKEEEQSNSVAA
jgi:protein KRI1